jgi:hypothetical protein
MVEDVYPGCRQASDLVWIPGSPAGQETTIQGLGVFSEALGAFIVPDL